MAGRTEHEHDRRGDRVHQQRQREEERKQDLENFQKMLEKTLKFEPEVLIEPFITGLNDYIKGLKYKYE